MAAQHQDAQSGRQRVSVIPGRLPGVLLKTTEGGGGAWNVVDFSCDTATSTSSSSSTASSTLLCQRLDELKFRRVPGKHALIRDVPRTSCQTPNLHEMERARSKVKEGSGAHERMRSQSPVRGHGRKQPGLMRQHAAARGVPKTASSPGSSSTTTSKNNRSNTTMMMLAAAAVAVAALAVISGAHDGDRASVSGAHTRNPATGGPLGSDALRARVDRASGRDGTWLSWPPHAAKAAASALMAHVPSPGAGSHDDGWDDPPQTEATVLMLVSDASRGGGGAAVVSAADASNAVQIVNDAYRETVVLDGGNPCRDRAGGTEEGVASTTSAQEEDGRGCIRDAAAAFLKEHPTGLVVLKNIRHVPGVLTIFHRCWDASGWLTPRDTASRVGCEQSTFVVELELTAAEAASVTQLQAERGGAANAGTARKGGGKVADADAGDPATPTSAQRYAASVRALKAVMAPIVCATKRKANEGEGKALLRRVSHWALLIPT